jgi:uncharacterized membrane protein SpoIIM required for sporulation/ABC-type transport system involved in multi-copper enzyme maturation permease subunit
LRDQMRDWRILVPLIILTFFFPFLMNFTAKQALDFVNRYGASLIGERIVPFLLLVTGFFPETISLVVALESFVGEKERGTIEPLLSSPLADWHLYLGKLLAGTIVPLCASYFGITVYLVGLYFENVPLPTLSMLSQTIILTTIQAVLMVSGAIVISAQSTSVRAANLLASFIIIPVALLVQGESVLMFWGNDKTLWLAVLGVLVLTALLIRVGLAHFKREHLLGREIDMLNLRWMWRTFWVHFTGGAKSLGEWYFKVLPGTIYRLRRSIAVIGLVGLVGAVIAFFWVEVKLPRLDSPLTQEQLRDFMKPIGQSLDMPTDGMAVTLSVPGLFLHNLRAELAALILGLVSFSVVGVMAYLVNMSMIGAVFGGLKALGLPALDIFLAGILPHGIFELTSVVLTSAAVLHMGVELVTPDPGRTFGQVYLETFADWLKIALGIGVPLLLIAAVIETYITPLLLVQVLSKVFAVN